MQDVGAELAATASLSVTIESEKGLVHATSGEFRVKECHLDLVSSAKWLSLLRESCLRTCLRSVTMTESSVVKDEALLFFGECCNEGVLQNRSLCNRFWWTGL